LRSSATLAASRTRRSCHGDFGSHCSGMSRYGTPGGLAATSRNDDVRLISSAVGPLSKYTMSTSPARSAAARVVSSGMLRNTSRLTDGVLRQ
jgi:hypothetical protein